MRHAPEDALSGWLRQIAALPVRAYLHLFHQLQIEGREHLPAEGSFVLISNHASHLDTLCLMAALPLARLPQAFPAVAQDYFSAGIPRVALAATFVNAVPVARQEYVRQSLTACRQILERRGSILILFPEGTRSTTGTMGAFRPGIASLVAGTDIPVVPCAVEGAFEAWPKGNLLPKPMPLRLVIGRARRYPHVAGGHQDNHRIAAELREAVQALL